MQQISVNVTIPIPEDSILISKVRLIELEQNELSGTFWNMKDLEQRTGRKQIWLKENILYPSKFRKELDVENGGFVSYPQASGQPWAFQASKMAAFLDKNFHRIFKERVN